MLKQKNATVLLRKMLLCCFSHVTSKDVIPLNAKLGSKTPYSFCQGNLVQQH